MSNTYDAFRIIREADEAGELTLLASHTDAEAPMMLAADEGWLEPQGAVPDEEYVAWCLEMCRTHSVDLLIAGRRRDILAAYKNEFEAAGTVLSVNATPEVMHLIEKKDAFYADLIGSGIPAADFRLVHDLQEFDAAYAELAPRYGKLCVKPASGMFGVGFRMLETEGDEFDLLAMDTKYRCSVTAFRTALAASSRPKRFLLMQYLEGDERSVDCVAVDGQLAVAVCRLKRGGYQITETSGPAIEITEALCRRYGLNGIFNLQTRDSGGETFLLEINSRMSGGLLYACLAGVALPYWVILLALGWEQIDAVPRPRAGVKIAPVQAAIVLSSAESELVSVTESCS